MLPIILLFRHRQLAELYSVNSYDVMLFNGAIKPSLTSTVIKVCTVTVTPQVFADLDYCGRGLVTIAVSSTLQRSV